MKMFLQHLQDAPLPPSQRTELPVPPEVDALVLACLQKDPARPPAERRGPAAPDRQHPRAAGRWSNEQARVWWQRHLPELAGPLATEEPVEVAVAMPALAGFHAR